MLGRALTAVEPAMAVCRCLRRDATTLHVGARTIELTGVGRVVLLAVGKAALPMAQAALDVAGEWIDAGLVITKDLAPKAYALPDRITIMQGGHPVPDDRSMEAGHAALRLLAALGPQDLVIALISGGGSALMTVPRPGLTLADLQMLTAALLAAGAPIDDINTLRRRCDVVKGGGLAAHGNGVQIAVLLLSDVLGDDLRAIASGPFVVAAETPGAIAAILRRYALERQLSPALRRVLLEAAPELVPPPPEMITHTVIANVWTAVETVAAVAAEHGLHVHIRREPLTGEARQVGPALIAEMDRLNLQRPACLIAGGETTVTLQGDGLGGRNQELALACVEPLHGRDLLLVALATDGGDGPTDAAGAVVNGDTLARAQVLGLDPADTLRRNDAYHFFAPLDDLLRPGPTHTNVNDLTMLIAP